MHIDINDNTPLREIQVVFSNFYPYLAISFYRKRHKKYEPSESSDLIDPDTTIGAIKKTHYSGILEIQPLYTVAEVEKEFQERFDLSVQILRKEKSEWEQSVGMDSFTLKELNEMGRNSSDETIVSDYNEGFKAVEEKPDELL
ncbi:hypothetical protein ACFSQD_05480 [Flavihumibacter stibioxidans]|uniref:Uncharacterized protein n=1 Tax=Flavihumibacter stibioxidans TaxID=1834163 RepID=A0ABR7M4T8_9BACT|nr:hypothetical protein [Flavihumibacter stibioxidans]MBC6489760.1 hypothetical protein [Flavihumibacter stibioxidans]